MGTAAQYQGRLIETRISQLSIIINRHIIHESASLYSRQDLIGASVFNGLHRLTN